MIKRNLSSNPDMLIHHVWIIHYHLLQKTIKITKILFFQDFKK